MFGSYPLNTFTSKVPEKIQFCMLLILYVCELPIRQVQNKALFKTTIPFKTLYFSDNNKSFQTNPSYG